MSDLFKKWLFLIKTGFLRPKYPPLVPMEAPLAPMNHPLVPFSEILEPMKTAKYLLADWLGTMNRAMEPMARASTTFLKILEPGENIKYPLTGWLGTMKLLKARKKFSLKIYIALAELLNCWIAELLNCWIAELLNCWIAHNTIMELQDEKCLLIMQGLKKKIQPINKFKNSCNSCCITPKTPS